MITMKMTGQQIVGLISVIVGASAIVATLVILTT